MARVDILEQAIQDILGEDAEGRPAATVPGIGSSGSASTSSRTATPAVGGTFSVSRSSSRAPEDSGPSRAVTGSTPVPGSSSRLGTKRDLGSVLAPFETHEQGSTAKRQARSIQDPRMLQHGDEISRIECNQLVHSQSNEFGMVREVSEQRNIDHLELIWLKGARVFSVTAAYCRVLVGNVAPAGGIAEVEPPLALAQGSSPTVELLQHRSSGAASLVSLAQASATQIELPADLFVLAKGSHLLVKEPATSDQSSPRQERGGGGGGGEDGGGHLVQVPDRRDIERLFACLLQHAPCPNGLKAAWINLHAASAVDLPQPDTDRSLRRGSRLPKHIRDAAAAAAAAANARMTLPIRSASPSPASFQPQQQLQQ